MRTPPLNVEWKGRTGQISPSQTTHQVQMIHKKNLSKLPPDMRYNKFPKEEKATNFKGARHSVFDRLRVHPHVIGVSITRIDQFGLIGVKHFLNFNFPLNVCWIFRFFANMNTLIESFFFNIFYIKYFFIF